MIARMKDDRRAAGKSKMRSRGAQALAAGCAVLVLVILGPPARRACARGQHRKPDVGNNVVRPTLLLLKQMTTAFNASHPGIVVSETNIPSATGDAKLQSQIAAGDPPSIFTEWNPVIGEYAADGSIISMNPYLTGAYKNFKSWEYRSRRPPHLQGPAGRCPMSLNSWALYYNKSILKAAGITSRPRRWLSSPPTRPKSGSSRAANYSR